MLASCALYGCHRTCHNLSIPIYDAIAVIAKIAGMNGCWLILGSLIFWWGWWCWRWWWQWQWQWLCGGITWFVVLARDSIRLGFMPHYSVCEERWVLILCCTTPLRGIHKLHPSCARNTHYSLTHSRRTHTLSGIVKTKNHIRSRCLRKLVFNKNSQGVVVSHCVCMCLCVCLCNCACCCYGH